MVTRRLSLSIGLMRLCIRYRGLGKVWWLSPLSGSRGTLLRCTSRVGITHLGSLVVSVVARCVDRRLVDLLAVAAAQQLTNRLLVVALCISIMVRVIFDRVSSCVLTLRGLMWKLCSPIRRLRCLRHLTMLLVS